MCLFLSECKSAAFGSQPDHKTDGSRSRGKTATGKHTTHIHCMMTHRGFTAQNQELKEHTFKMRMCVLKPEGSQFDYRMQL